MKRDRAYIRKARMCTIRRKSALLRRLGGGDLWLYEGWTRGHPGRFAKGKIHCSCWMCRTKSYDRLSRSDLKKKIGGKQQLKDYDAEMSYWEWFKCTAEGSTDCDFIRTDA